MAGRREPVDRSVPVVGLEVRPGAARRAVAVLDVAQAPLDLGDRVGLPVVAVRRPSCCRAAPAGCRTRRRTCSRRCSFQPLSLVQSLSRQGIWSRPKPAVEQERRSRGPGCRCTRCRTPARGSWCWRSWDRLAAACRCRLASLLGLLGPWRPPRPRPGPPSAGRRLGRLGARAAFSPVGVDRRAARVDTASGCGLGRVGGFGRHRRRGRCRRPRRARGRRRRRPGRYGRPAVPGHLRPAAARARDSAHRGTGRSTTAGIARCQRPRGAGRAGATTSCGRFAVAGGGPLARFAATHKAFPSPGTRTRRRDGRRCP